MLAEPFSPSEAADPKTENAKSFSQLLSRAIEDNLHWIPELWPLQQFVALNPLQDQTQNHFVQTAQNFHDLVQETLFLPLADYLAAFEAGTISPTALEQAIEETVCQRMPSCQDVSQRTYVQELCLNFMKSTSVQSQILSLLESIESEEEHDTRSSKLLVAYQLQPYFYDDPAQSIRSACLSLLSTFVNQNQLPWPAPQGDESILVWAERLWCSQDQHWCSFFDSKPNSLDAWVQQLLNDLQVPQSDVQDYIFQILWQIKGWTGFFKWQLSHPNHPWKGVPCQIREVLLLWLLQECYWLSKNAAKLREFKAFTSDDASVLQKQWVKKWQNIWQSFVAQNHQQDQGNSLVSQEPIEHIHSYLAIWQRAYELDYEHDLCHNLRDQASQSPQLRTHVQSQWFVCIDVRSEGLRRHLESSLDCETIGAAGFFGFAYHLLDESEHRSSCQCPALLQPDITLAMQKAADNWVQGAQKSFKATIHTTKKSMSAAFALVEILGLWYAFALLGRTFLTAVSALLSKELKRNPSDSNELQLSVDTVLQGFNIEAAVDLGYGLLQSVGWQDRGASFIVLCGHGAEAQNNPYLAALNCGACGGNAGSSNAMVAAHILNHPHVRAGLRAKGLDIPDQTVCVAACHNTTQDRIEWFDHDLQLNPGQKTELQQLKKETAAACQNLVLERQQDLPGDVNVIRRSHHWGELIPEWGLANNATMIVAPRELTLGLNLKRRAFLHNYSPDQDPTGEVLEKILLAPAIVAQGINMQYYCSAVLPQVLGSGNKAIHNVLSGVGVMEGNQSDLKYGLPSQSVFFQDKRMHQVRRLLLVVYAPQERVDALIKKHSLLKELVQGQWLHLKVIEPQPS